MQFDAENTVVKLCAKGMEREAVNGDEAKELFMQARESAIIGVEKFTAAHYVARHQPDVQIKLRWMKQRYGLHYK